MSASRILIIFSAVAIGGCWTFCESEYPKVEIPSRAECVRKLGGNAATNLTISVRGFAALLTEYEAVHGFQTVYVPGYCGYRYYHPGYYETVSVSTYMPQRRSTDMFLRRAVDTFEKTGIIVSDVNPDCIVEVSFDGPFVDSGDEVKRLAWNVFSVFFCDYSAVRWNAALRIRDARTGRLIHHRDLTQRYETNVFGLIPLFGISSSKATDGATMQTWCLSALTDCAVADAVKSL